MKSGAGVHNSVLVAGAHHVHGALVVNDGIHTAGGLLLLHGDVHVGRGVDLYGATRAAGLTSLAGGMAVSHEGVRVGYSLKVDGFGGFTRNGVTASGGLNASNGALSFARYCPTASPSGRIVAFQLQSFEHKI